MPSSRPMPDCFTPPNGHPRVGHHDFVHEHHARHPPRRRSGRRAAASRVHTLAPSPKRVALAQRERGVGDRRRGTPARPVRRAPRCAAGAPIGHIHEHGGRIEEAVPVRHRCLRGDARTGAHGRVDLLLQVVAHGRRGQRPDVGGRDPAGRRRAGRACSRENRVEELVVHARRRSTKRLAAMHDCPELTVRPFTAARAARSTSASWSTMNGSLPPSSSTTFLRCRPAAVGHGLARAFAAGERHAGNARVRDQVGNVVALHEEERGQRRMTRRCRRQRAR